MEPTPLPNPPSSPKLSFQSLVVPLIFLLFVGIGILSYQNFLLKKQLEFSTNLPKPTPVPTETPDQTNNLNISTMKGCGTDDDNFSYSIKIPNSWKLYMTENNSNKTGYKIITHTPAYIRIACDTTEPGNIICLNNGESHNPFDTKIFTNVDGCFWNYGPDTNSLEAEYIVANSIGVFTISSFGVKKSVLEAILSTFTFTR